VDDIAAIAIVVTSPVPIRQGDAGRYPLIVRNRVRSVTQFSYA